MGAVNRQKQREKSTYDPGMDSNGHRDADELLRSFVERHSEADSNARNVLDEFIRVATALPPDSILRQELVALDESWRDTLSDSQVIRHLRVLHPESGSRKGKRGIARERSSRRR